VTDPTVENEPMLETQLPKLAALETDDPVEKQSLLSESCMLCGSSSTNRSSSSES
jgi:hypothetical protein